MSKSGLCINLLLILTTASARAELIDGSARDLPAAFKKTFRKMAPRVDPDKCVWSYDTVTTVYATECPVDPETPGGSKFVFSMKENGGKPTAHFLTDNQEYELFVPQKILKVADKHMNKLRGKSGGQQKIFSAKIKVSPNGKPQRFEISYWDGDKVQCDAVFDAKGKILNAGKCGPLKE